MNSATRKGIAERIRGIIGGRDASVERIAARLRVDEVALRMTIDDLSPYPTIDVLAAVVREYGVDPSWLVTGNYNEATHRRALGLDSGELPAAIDALLAAGTRTTPVSAPRILWD